jgi:hypothetical protein
VKTVIEASTGASYSLQMPIAKTCDHHVVLGLYRNDSRHPFTSEEVAYMESLTPIIISWAQSLTSLKESTLRQTGSNLLLEKD